MAVVGRRWRAARGATCQPAAESGGVGAFQPAPRPAEGGSGAARFKDLGPNPNFGAGAVTAFKGQHAFLSNFSWSTVRFEGEEYPSVEHAFQAAKLRTSAERREYGFCSPGLSFGEAKRLGRKVPLREDWRSIREDVMTRCLASKFSEPGLRRRLLDTCGRELINGHWGSPDTVWGYHFPSKAGENRLGRLLMELWARLAAEAGAGAGLPAPELAPAQAAPLQPLAAVGDAARRIGALFHLDWPMKCLHEGLPAAYASRIEAFARELGLQGCLAELPRRRICIALRGPSEAVEAWERRIRTEHVDTNSRGRPCRERMLARLLLAEQPEEAPSAARGFRRAEVDCWGDLLDAVASGAQLLPEAVATALGPELPELPTEVRYAPGRVAVFLLGQRFTMCLNDHAAAQVDEPLLGDASIQEQRGVGEVVPRAGEACPRPGMFGGLFARTLPGLLSVEECGRLVELSERQGYGLAGSRGFNPFARFALRALVDAPAFASALTERLRWLLPREYPLGSGRAHVGVNERCRFLKYEMGEPIKQKGFTALMYACQGGYEACVSALLDARARANAKDEDGTTALHLAAASGDIGCARLLLMAGAKCTLDEDGQGVLEYLPSDVRADSGEIKNWEDLISDSARK